MLVTKKSEQALFERAKEHVAFTDSAIKGHLGSCSNVEHLFSIYNFILHNVKYT